MMDMDKKHNSFLNTNRMIVCALFATFILLLVSAGAASAATITVDDSGGADYMNIPDAVTNANEGDTVLVYSGIYYEDVYIDDKRLVLRGVDIGNGIPIVHGRIHITSDGNILENIVKEERSIDARSNNNIIKYNTINSKYGIRIWGNWSNNTLMGNTINYENSGRGIWLINSAHNNIVIGNRIRGYGSGIELKDSYNNTIISNFVEDSGIFINYGQNNTIYYNHFINSIHYDSSSYPFNQWDDGVNGNHYDIFDESAEGCFDSDTNGLCDSNYSIEGGSSIDRYPKYFIDDFTPPSISIQYPNEGAIISTPTITIIGIASDDSAISSVIVNGAPVIGYTNWSANVRLVEGENIITIVAKDLQNNKQINKLTVYYYYPLEDIHPIFTYPAEIELGGTYYKWYKTIPYSTISIDSNYLEYSQPDESGIFSILVNTSKLGITAPETLDIVTNSASIAKNGQTTQADTSTLNFALNILPRNYSTSWYLGSTLGGGGGIIAYAEGERNVDFTMTTGSQDSILEMIRDQNDKGTVGASVGFEAKAPIIGEVEFLNGDIHASMQKMYGSQVSVDYENANDFQKFEGALYILTSTLSTINPLMYETIDAISNNITSDLTTDYYESGVASSGGSSLSLFNIGMGPKSATVGSLDIGLGFEVGQSLKNRTYTANDYQEYLIQYVYNAKAGVSGSLLGNDIVDWGPSQFIDSTVILGQDNNKVLYGKLKIKDDEKPVMFDYVSRELTYDYGQITDENIINPFETDDIPISSTFNSFIDYSKNNKKGNVTIYETRGQKLALELPLELKVSGIKLSLNPGIRMGAANNYLTDENIMHNQKPYALEKYTYDTQVQGSAEELNYIIESLLAPVGALMDPILSPITDMIEQGKELYFNTGKIIFDGITYFTTIDQSVATSSMLPSSVNTQSPLNNQTPEIIISTYASTEPAPQAMAALSSMGMSSSYATSLSGGSFVIGNITDLQPYNISFTPAAQLTLNYTDTDIVGIDESNISIYRWDDSNNSWIQLPSIVNMAGNNASTNITRFGTYAIGYDISAPIIKWNSSNIYQGNVTVEALVTDSGSGINTSSIQLYLDGQEQAFTYNIFSGLLKSTINTSAGNHTVRIYAEDTSGNSNITEKDVISINPTYIQNFTINYTNNTLGMSWIGGNGTYQIQYYHLYSDTELISNITQTDITLNFTGSATYTIYPIDTNGNSGVGESITYSFSQLVPQFTYNWADKLYPIVGNPITFDGGNSYLLNGTVNATITSYIWVFDDDVNNTTLGKVTNHTFVDSGFHKITLQIEDDYSNNNTLTEIININGVNGTITGIVTNETSSPISGAMVKLTEYPQYSDTTTSDGRYFINNVPEGTYNLTSTNEPEYYPNSSVAVDLISGGTVMQNIELATKPTGTISGNVTNAS